MKSFRVGVMVMGIAAGLLPTRSVGAGLGADGLRVYGEERQVNVEDEWGTLAFQNKDLVGGAKPKTVTFDSAIKLAHDLANKAVPKAKLAEARKTQPAGNDSYAYLLLGARSAASGNFGVTLAFFVASYDADQKNAEAWFNTASCLALLTYPNEALAILQEMQKRGLKLDPAMGLTGEDVMDYERGFCLTAIGDKTGARKLLEAVADRQPLLSEASKLLALIDEAEGKNPRANFIRGVWRRRGTVTVCGGQIGSGPEPDAMTTGEEVAMDLREIIDMSKGKVGQLPRGRYPASLEEARAQSFEINKKKKELSDEMNAVLKQEREAMAKLKRKDADGNPTWGMQLYDLMFHIDWRDRKLREFNTQIVPRGSEYLEAKERALDYIREGDDVFRKSKDKTLTTERAIKRPYYTRALQAVLSACQKEEQLSIDTFAEWHRLATAIGANLGDPGWREVFRLRIASRRALMQSTALTSVSSYCHFADTYLWDPSVVDPLEKSAAQDMEKCDGSKSIGVNSGSLIGSAIGSIPGKEVVSEHLPFEVGVELNCEGMSLELGVGEGIQGSAELGITPKGGFNIFIGPRGTLNLGTPVGVTSKAGISISGDKSGVTEIALKTETKTTVSEGPFTLANKVHEASVVMVSTATPQTLTEGLAPFGGGNP